MPAEQPQPPKSLPKYLVEGVPKQDDSALRDLQAWIDELIEYRTDISVDEIEVDKEERIEEVDDTGETTTVIKKVPCGKKSCSTCPHGPYRYEVHRDGGSLVWEYKGAVDE
jgi:hypothetical protein